MIDWVEKSCFYHIYPIGTVGAPRINDENTQLEHRILKLIDWIPHLKEMGINAVYIGPLFESGSHGYDTHDYMKLDKRLGDNDDMKKFCKAYHDAGIRIVLDGVFNHVGRGFFAFQDILKNREGSQYKDWFSGLNFGGNNGYNDGLSYENWGGADCLVKLNLYNPDTRKHLFDAVTMWMDEFGIDGLRLDAADCIQKDFFKELKHITKSKNPDFWLMGEIIHGDYNMWANDEMMDSVTNYECWKGIYSSHNDHNYFEINYAMNRQAGNGGIYAGKLLYNFIDNHDVNRIASLLKEKENLKNCFTMLYTMPGIPSIYYGSEWGIEGVKASGEETDYPLRPEINISEMKGVAQGIIDHISELAARRAVSPALRHGIYQQIIVQNEHLVYGRVADDDYAIAAFNCTANPIHLDFGFMGKNFSIDLGAFDSTVITKEEPVINTVSETISTPVVDASPIDEVKDEVKDEVIETKEELKAVSEKTDEKPEERKLKYFGTDGFRGLVNETLTVDHAIAIGKYLGYHFCKDGKSAKCVIGKDTRRSSYMYEYGLVAGLTSTGVDVYLMHVTTTPSVAYITKTEDFDFGIMITASHNPYHDNGIKVLDSDGYKMSEDVLMSIEDFIDGRITIDLAKYDKIGSCLDYIQGRSKYISYLTNTIGVSLRGYNIALDCANGASWSIAKSVFDMVGAKTYTLNCNPDGYNINRDAGSTHIEGLANYVRENGLDMGFAFDGDADRCLAVDGNGNIVDGDMIIYMCGIQLKEKGILVDDTVVTTVMSNIGFTNALKKHGIKNIQTSVGDKYISEELKAHNYTVGGEQSGHVIFNKYATTGDGILTALKVMEVVCEKKMPLSGFFTDLILYPQTLINIKVNHNMDALVEHDQVQAKVAEIENRLGDDGRVLLRKSGTEPLIRIMVEAKEDSDAKNCAQEIYNLIEKIDQQM